MKFEYDASADNGYLEFLESDDELTTRELLPWLHGDFDAEGRLVGIEVLDASHHLSLDGVTPQVELVGTKEAAALFGVKVPNFIRDIASARDFPEPLASLASTRVWDKTALLAYQVRRAHAR